MLKFSQNIWFKKNIYMKEKYIYLKNILKYFILNMKIFKIRWLFGIEMLNFVWLLVILNSL
jgi:hypothetical protein